MCCASAIMSMCVAMSLGLIAMLRPGQAGTPQAWRLTFQPTDGNTMKKGPRT
jgi:hypothetical protein